MLNYNVTTTRWRNTANERAYQQRCHRLSQPRSWRRKRRRAVGVVCLRESALGAQNTRLRADTRRQNNHDLRSERAPRPRTSRRLGTTWLRTCATHATTRCSGFSRAFNGYTRCRTGAPRSRWWTTRRCRRVTSTARTSSNVTPQFPCLGRTKSRRGTRTTSPEALFSLFTLERRCFTVRRWWRLHAKPREGRMASTSWNSTTTRRKVRRRSPRGPCRFDTSSRHRASCSMQITADVLSNYKK
mmetsp:Transcript_4667/g.11504  ORF Transcript_4667/g.11504 Transcript_4667/m.11504 type:complete len:243 (+) Transcript_4667:336-1064(+)